MILSKKFLKTLVLDLIYSDELSEEEEIEELFYLLLIVFLFGVSINFSLIDLINLSGSLKFSDTSSNLLFPFRLS